MIIHNDLKGDNVVLSSSPVLPKVKPVIIDFGKACETTKGKTYKLTEKEKKKYESVHRVQLKSTAVGFTAVGFNTSINHALFVFQFK